MKRLRNAWRVLTGRAQVRTEPPSRQVFTGPVTVHYAPKGDAQALARSMGWALRLRP